MAAEKEVAVRIVTMEEIPAKNRNDKTSEYAFFKLCVTNKYCWTYREYAHKSTELTRQETGHKVEATLTSRIGG